MKEVVNVVIQVEEEDKSPLGELVREEEEDE
jgi:hypothetical protein